MEIRYDLQNNKETELIKIIDTVTNESSLDSSLLFENFKKNCINITPPEEEPPMMQFLTIDSLKNYKSGQSIKPGNIKLNIKKLINTLPAIVETSVGILYDIPILQVCAALTLWKTLCNIFTVEITREQPLQILCMLCSTDYKTFLLHNSQPI